MKYGDHKHFDKVCDWSIKAGNCTKSNHTNVAEQALEQS